MARVRISFETEVDDSYLGELMRIVDHHMDYLIDFDGNPELNGVENAELEELD